MGGGNPIIGFPIPGGAPGPGAYGICTFWYVDVGGIEPLFPMPGSSIVGVPDLSSSR